MSLLTRNKHVDISIIQLAIKNIANHTADGTLDPLRLSAYCNLEDLSHILGSRILTSNEMATFQYSIEVIIRLDSSRYRGNASFKEKRRAKLTAYYSNYDRSKDLRSCRK